MYTEDVSGVAICVPSRKTLKATSPTFVYLEKVNRTVSVTGAQLNSHDFLLLLRAVAVRWRHRSSLPNTTEPVSPEFLVIFANNSIHLWLRQSDNGVF